MTYEYNDTKWYADNDGKVNTILERGTQNTGKLQLVQRYFNSEDVQVQLTRKPIYVAKNGSLMGDNNTITQHIATDGRGSILNDGNGFYTSPNNGCSDMYVGFKFKQLKGEYALFNACLSFVVSSAYDIYLYDNRSMSFRRVSFPSTFNDTDNVMVKVVELSAQDGLLIDGQQATFTDEELTIPPYLQNQLLRQNLQIGQDEDYQTVVLRCGPHTSITNLRIGTYKNMMLRGFNNASTSIEDIKLRRVIRTTTNLGVSDNLLPGDDNVHDGVWSATVGTGGIRVHNTVVSLAVNQTFRFRLDSSCFYSLGFVEVTGDLAGTYTLGDNLEFSSLDMMDFTNTYHYVELRLLGGYVHVYAKTLITDTWTYLFSRSIPSSLASSSNVHVYCWGTTPTSITLHDVSMSRNVIHAPIENVKGYPPLFTRSKTVPILNTNAGMRADWKSYPVGSSTSGQLSVNTSSQSNYGYRYTPYYNVFVYNPEIVRVNRVPSFMDVTEYIQPFWDDAYYKRIADQYTVFWNASQNKSYRLGFYNPSTQDWLLKMERGNSGDQIITYPRGGTEYQITQSNTAYPPHVSCFMLTFEGNLLVYEYSGSGGALYDMDLENNGGLISDFTLSGYHFAFQKLNDTGYIYLQYFEHNRSDLSTIDGGGGE